MVAAVFRTIFAQPDPEAVNKAWDEVRDQLATSFPKVGPLIDDAKAEVLTFTGFPKAHWRKIWSTNPLERVNKEIKRRSRVVGIFPNPTAVIRLVGAVLIDMHDEWIAGDRRYLSEESMRCSTPPWILELTPPSTAASRAPKTTSKPTTPRGSVLLGPSHQPAPAARAVNRSRRLDAGSTARPQQRPPRRAARSGWSHGTGCQRAAQYPRP